MRLNVFLDIEPGKNTVVRRAIGYVINADTFKIFSLLGQRLKFSLKSLKKWQGHQTIF
jgi:hypothetical protein